MADQHKTTASAANIGPDKKVLAYLIDAVKYLCADDPETARRSLEHAKSHFDKAYLGQAVALPDPWERGGLTEGKQ